MPEISFDAISKTGGGTYVSDGRSMRPCSVQDGQVDYVNSYPWAGGTSLRGDTS